jgi:hypothetical protein
MSRICRVSVSFSAFLVVLLTGCAAGRPDSSPPAALTDVPVRFATLDGYRVAYRSAGRGEPAVVFVHGWTCDMTSFRFQFACQEEPALMSLSLLT